MCNSAVFSSGLYRYTGAASPGWLSRNDAYYQCLPKRGGRGRLSRRSSAVLWRPRGLSKRLLVAEAEGAYQRGFLPRRSRGLVKEASCRGKREGLSKRLLFTEAEGLVRAAPLHRSRGCLSGRPLSRTPRGLVKETSCHGSRGSFITVTAASSGAGRQGKRGFFYCKVRRVMVFFSCKIRSPRFITVNTGERFRP